MFTSDLKHSSRTLEEKLTRLYGMGRKTINLSFRPPFLELLQAFGNPQLKLPPIIHVAGTNGKGSIIATLRAILEAEGYKVHAYTSPHLCKFNERIVLAGEYITDNFLESLIDEAIELNEDKDVTFFEITTALAMAAFARTQADVLLLEVGLGGRQDCTNVVEKSLVSIISSIGYDHMEWLGETLPLIAAEKAGIMKYDVPCVISAQSHESQASGVMDIFASIAAEKGSPLSRHGAEWFTHDQGDLFKFVYKDVEMSLPRPSLCGSHQISNTGAALAALKIIAAQLPVSQAAIEKGLRNIHWPARLQNLTNDSLPKDWELWLDGGHNEDAANILAAQAEHWHEEDGKPLHLILGMMNHKHPADFLKPLLPYATSISLVNISDEPKSHSAADLLNALGTVKIRKTCHRDFSDAIPEITKEPTSGRILICGSLYLAGHVLKSLGIQP